MTAMWPDVVDQALQSELESLLVASGVRYRRDERLVPYHVITYDLETRENEELRLSLELVSDQLNVCFNDCYLMVEHEAYTSRFGRNPSSMAEWRGECAETVRAVLRSDLRIALRTWGNTVLGGFLWSRDGKRWTCLGGGGSFLWPLGFKRSRDFNNWMAR
jgi:hypothetical protein